MPVTAQLPRRFYEALADEIANELVEWFNRVDPTYRTDLRELSELKFARFDARLEQRIGGVESPIREVALEVERRQRSWRRSCRERLPISVRK